MHVLGIVGGIDLPFETKYPNEYRMIAHDAAAVLVKDGEIVAAAEEERLSRIKHDHKAPARAMKYCLESTGIKLNDIDEIAVYGTENIINDAFKKFLLAYPKRKNILPIREEIHRIVKSSLGEDFDDSKLKFVPHHLAHAVSAFAMSGFEKSLILTIDGEGDKTSGLVALADGNEYNIIQTFSNDVSLGYFYLDVISFLGYGFYDEYKVMGLAPYGDASKFRRIFKKMYVLSDNGTYKINREFIPVLFNYLVPRRKGDPFLQIHKDIAASLQEALEEIVLHILKYYKASTKQTRLCLAGGVAHNCSLNGKILYSDLFEDIFVQPAAHDAGCALGAALYTYIKSNPMKANKRLNHVFWGSDVENHEIILKELNIWKDYISFERKTNIAQETAALLSDGAVIGWVQGRSEFGPRALGNRSIIADPRPYENKDIINSMVKKRESYRPFAPSVLEEYLTEYYDVPFHMKQLPFMNFVVKTREEKRKILGAVTHIDGTARIQTVSKESNPVYWNLINEFRILTGIPILLNTSFNNNLEPIVDSINDAIVCFLTTKLDYLVLENYLIKRQDINNNYYLNMILSIPLHVILHHSKKYQSFTTMIDVFEIGNNFNPDYNIELSYDTYHILSQANGCKSIGELLEGYTSDDKSRNYIVKEMVELWASRMIELRPKL